MSEVVSQVYERERIQKSAHLDLDDIAVQLRQLLEYKAAYATALLGTISDGNYKTGLEAMEYVDEKIKQLLWIK